ncbi:MAG: hypothetical protein ACK5NN_15165 [Sphingomonadaceae bacterium]
MTDTANRPERLRRRARQYLNRGNERAHDLLMALSRESHTIRFSDQAVQHIDGSQTQ